MSKSKVVNVVELPHKHATFLTYCLPVNKKGYTKVYKGEIKNVIETTILVGEFELLELIAEHYKIEGSIDIDIYIDFIDKDIQVNDIKFNQDAQKILPSIYYSIIKNAYHKGMKNASDMLTNSIMECDDIDTIIGDVHLRIEKLWNNDFMRKNPKHRRISIEKFL